jgi:hypothetical protein
MPRHFLLPTLFEVDGHPNILAPDNFPMDPEAIGIASFKMERP